MPHRLLAYTLFSVLLACLLGLCFGEVRVAADATQDEIKTWRLGGFSAATWGPFVLLPMTAILYWAFTSSSPSSSKSSAGAAAVYPAGTPLPIKQTQAKQSTSTDTDIVIIGAGVAGASLGAALAARGHRVVVVEQSLEEPNRIVGELLQPSGCAILREIGLADALEGFDAQKVHGYGIFHGKEMLTLDYPRDAAGNVLEGRSFHNGRFLMALRKELTKFGGELRQGTVTGMLETGPNGRVNGVTYRTRSGEVHSVTAALTVACDGLFSSFRGKLVENTFQKRSTFLGLILENPAYPQPLGGNVFLADPTPILLYPISSTEARMLVDFPGEVPSEKEALKQFLIDHTLHQLPSSLHASFIAAVKDGSTLKSMPARQMCARPMRKPGCLTLGDLLSIRHPLTGGGMTVAFTDVRNILAKLEAVQDFNDHAAIDAAVKLHYGSRSSAVAAINILADALYDVFGQKYASLRAACYSYLSQGGEMSGGPIRLLSGVSRSQALLVGHFFAVAFWGVYKNCWPLPTPSSLKKSFLMIRDACIIIFPLLLAEHPGWFFQATCAVLRTIFWIPHTSYVFKQPK